MDIFHSNLLQYNIEIYIITNKKLVYFIYTNMPSTYKKDKTKLRFSITH